jgi:hypothetical protein
MLAVTVVLKAQSFLEEGWALEVCVIVDRGIVGSDVRCGGASGLWGPPGVLRVWGPTAEIALGERVPLCAK